MTPLPITLCGPIPHTLVRGLFREPPALQEAERKILLPLKRGTKPTRQHLSVSEHDPSSVTWKQTFQSPDFADSNCVCGCRNVLHIEYGVKFAVFQRDLISPPVGSVQRSGSDERWTGPFISDFHNPPSEPEMVRPYVNRHSESMLGIH